MKFYGDGVFWDKKSNKRLCKFANGELETEDERTIEALTKACYPHEEEKKMPAVRPKPTFKPKKKKVRK